LKCHSSCIRSNTTKHCLIKRLPVRLFKPNPTPTRQLGTLSLEPEILRLLPQTDGGKPFEGHKLRTCTRIAKCKTCFLPVLNTYCP
jgi:hypothetical protein